MKFAQKSFIETFFNFDGELFDIELDRIMVTVMKINGIPTLLNLLDVDDDVVAWMEIPEYKE